LGEGLDVTLLVVANGLDLLVDRVPIVAATGQDPRGTRRLDFPFGVLVEELAVVRRFEVF
jgi:hypothetical protein